MKSRQREGTKMAYFPFMMDIEGKQCLIVGGGNLAYKKAEMILSFGANVVLVAPDICSQLSSLEGKSTQLSIIRREFLESDVESADMVIAATNNEGLNTQIFELCKEKKILVNVVDVKEECSFIFPALIRQNNILVTVSTGGNSPAIAAHLKNKIEEHMPRYYGEMADTLGSFREYIKEEIRDANVRKAFYYELIDQGERYSGIITKKDLDDLIKKYKK